MTCMCNEKNSIKITTKTIYFIKIKEKQTIFDLYLLLKVNFCLKSMKNIKNMNTLYSDTPERSL